MKKNDLNGPNMFFGATPIIFERARELRGNQTKAEKLLWSRLAKKQLGVKFRRQHPIDRFIADFYCHEVKLVVEIDGAIHLQKELRENDDLRDKIMTDMGIEILRFKNDEIFHKLSKVVEIISFTITTIKAH
jgi:imidazole glycerol-phosphate synthase subunit HisF